MNGNNILITGALGNLGLWISNHFANLGANLYLLDVKSMGLKIEKEHTFISCDISNLEDCRKKLSDTKIDYVIHLASLNENEIPNYAEKALAINSLGTRNLLETLKKHTIKNFIYFSTFHIYGKESGIIDETTLPTPKTDYALTHLFAEFYVKQYNINYQIPYTILRLTNSYGAPKDINTTKWYLVLNNLAKMAYEDKIIKLNTNGNAQRDFIWMGDVCKTISEILKVEAKNDTFNLSSGNSIRIIDIAKIVSNAYNEEFGLSINIEVNKNDNKIYNDNLNIVPKKILDSFPINFKDMFYKEAIDIFLILK